MEVQYHEGRCSQCKKVHHQEEEVRLTKQPEMMLKSTSTAPNKTMNGPKPPIDTKIYYHLWMPVSPFPDPQAWFYD